MIKLNSSFEGEIVKYYDLYFLPKEKVSKEIDYILNMCKRYISDYDLCLDIGCGTGAYSEVLSKHFDKVLGMDLSKDMIDYADINHKNERISYIHKDARCMEDITCGAGAGFAVSLAHVVGYQLDNGSLENYFKTACVNLKKGGVFWFNFYNQPALFFNALSPRHMKINDSGCEISRISNASIDAESNCLNMDYYYIVNRDGLQDIIEIHEKMRYFTRLELE